MHLRRILILVYIFVGLFEIFGELVNAKMIVYLSKPLLMPILAGILITMVNIKTGKGHKNMLAALMFSLVGDVLLMIRPGSELLFIGGLSAFLLAHLCYLIAFRDDTATPYNAKWSLSDYVMPVLLVSHSILIGALMITNLHGIMLVAVPLYVLVITAMGITAAMRTRDGFTLDRVILLSGVILFILSDTLIGVTKFMDPDIPYARTAIMTLYISGQLFIVLGWGNKKVWEKPELVSRNA